MIRLHFPTPADSPTGASPLRIRYSIQREGGRAVPVLRYAHGTRELTREAWPGFEAAGARIECDSPREAGVVAEALALPPDRAAALLAEATAAQGSNPTRSNPPRD